MENLPLFLAYTGMAVMLAVAGIGSAIGITVSGNATISALKKNPDMFGKAMILCVLPSTQGLYGFAGFFLMLSSLQANAAITLNQGLAMCVSGLACGIVGFYSCLRQSGLVANGVNEMGNGQDVFAKTMILAVFPELYAILAFAAAFLALP